MRQESSSHMLDGVKDCLPVLVAVVPFSAIFGAIAIENGFTLLQVMLVSASVYAVASQYVMVDLLSQEVPVWSIVLAIGAMNFRHVLYSASIGRFMGGFSGIQKVLAFFFLVDPLYAATEARASKGILRPSYYFGYALTMYTTWMGANLVGALFGALLENPGNYGLDFILPVYFACLVVGFHKRPNFLPVLLASVAMSLLVFFTIGSPWHISLGGVAGIVLAALLSKPKETVVNG